MITRVYVENFKSLKQVNIELKPLTIFIGPNGAGKSSILQSILILKKLYNVQGNLTLNGLFHLEGYLNMGSWKDVAYYVDKPIRLSVEVTNKNARAFLNATIFKDRKVSLNVKLRIGDVETNLTKSVALPYSQKQSQTITIKVDDGALYGDWDGFNVSITSATREIPEVLRSTVISLLNEWHHNVFFIPSTISMFRQPQITIGMPKREHVIDNIKRSLLIGEGLLMSLIAVDPNIEDYVIRCTKEIFGVEVRSRPFPQNVWRIISSIRKGKTIPIVNEGGGINRCVYMFTILALADEDSVIMIEEPETNLHPGAQYSLAKIIVEAVVDERKQLLVTTHSEHLLFGILRQIAKGKMDLKDLAIFYVQKERENTTLKILEVDERGRVKGGLPGFFEEEVKELIDILSS